ncbi:hypothetical protein HDU97_000125 [Phlyctochytrium planicorne]|nr:hypothetical protein HDU97_000125 [Phlyctochytrium planicorne]
MVLPPLPSGISSSEISGSLKRGSNCNVDLGSDAALSKEVAKAKGKSLGSLSRASSRSLQRLSGSAGNTRAVEGEVDQRGSKELRRSASHSLKDLESKESSLNRRPQSQKGSRTLADQKVPSDSATESTHAEQRSSVGTPQSTTSLDKCDDGETIESGSLDAIQERSRKKGKDSTSSPTAPRSRAQSQTAGRTGHLKNSKAGASKLPDGETSHASLASKSRRGSVNISNSSVTSRPRKTNNASNEVVDDSMREEHPSENTQSVKFLTPSGSLGADGGDVEGLQKLRDNSSRCDRRLSMSGDEPIRGRSVISVRTASVNPNEIRREISSSVNYSVQARDHNHSSGDNWKHPDGAPYREHHVGFAPQANGGSRGGSKLTIGPPSHRRVNLRSRSTPAEGPQRIQGHIKPDSANTGFVQSAGGQRYGLSQDCVKYVKKGVESREIASTVMDTLVTSISRVKQVQAGLGIRTERRRSYWVPAAGGGEGSSGPPSRPKTSSGTELNSNSELFYGRETFESARDHARHRWYFALQFTLKLMKATVLFRHMLPPHRVAQQLELMDSADMETQGLTYMLKAHQAKADIAFSSRVQSMLAQPRTAQVVSTLQRLLALRVKAFERFSHDQQVELCKYFTYESRDQSTVIVKEGHEVIGFYFILSGQCEAYKTKNDKKYRTNILNTGDFFGENRTDGKRTYSVACTMQTELLKIDAENFEMIMHMNDQEYIATRVAALQQIPHFSNVHPSIIERIAQVSQLHSYMAQEAIVKEGYENYLLHWIVSGSCRAIKLVPFVKRWTTPKCALHSAKYTVLPYVEGMESMPQDEITMQLLNIRELKEGDHFPDMAAAINPERFNKIELMSRLSSDNPNRLDARSYVSVVTNTKVEVISMTRVDYARVATNDMILKILADRCLLHVPIQDLQTSVLQKREWDICKKRYVEKVSRRH